MTPAGPDYAAQDEEARARIREALDATLFVEAGAGTGKTRALVDRVVALVLGGRPIERIAAITFTEKAAAELKDRVRGELERVLMEESEHAPLVQEALTALDRAQISTIHAFGQSLLRFFGAEAAIDPDFVLLDEVLADRRFQERWHIYLEDLADDPLAVAAVDRALSLGLAPGDLETLGRELTARAHLASRLAANPLSAPAVVWPEVEEMLRDLRTLPLDVVPTDDRLRLRIENLASFVNRLSGAGEAREEVLAAGAGILDRSYSRTGRAGNWGGGEAIGSAREAAESVTEELKEVLTSCRSKALADLMPFIVRFVQEDAQLRGREGTLTFDDLILRPRDLLWESAEAATALRERFDVLLIDEFQDTDPLQVDIALAFATDPSTGALEPGRLFLVGDPKQSIYRFRQADMAIYARMRDLVQERGGELPSLALCRRSRPEILDWVNEVFGRLIGGGSDPAIQPPYHPIHAHRSIDLRGPGVATIGGEVEMKARELRESEAAQLAAQCRAVLDERWEVAEGDGTVREARYRDIAILIPRRAILPALERSLAAAEIPYQVEGGSLIYRTQEIRDLINCLTAIDDPADEVAVVGALRSPAFACSDVELAQHRAAGGSFNYLTGRERQANDGPVAKALSTLAQHHSVRHRQSLASLVEGFIASRGLVEIGMLDQGDRNSFRRMRFMVEQARSFEASGPESLRAFVSWMEQRSTDAILDHEGAGLDDDEDAVRVLTIHGAKGLEFPIVFVAGLSAKPNWSPFVYGVDHAGDRIAVSIGSKSRAARFQLGPADVVGAAEEQHADAEFNRMLYVASTRARDHLVVSLYHSSSRANDCAARRLIEAGACDVAQPLPELGTATQTAVAPFAGLKVDSPEVVSEDEFSLARRELVQASRRQRYTSATALGPIKKNETSDESEPWSRGRGGTRLGRAVHAALQSLPLDADQSLIEALSRAQAVAEAIPSRSRDVARLVSRALESQAAGRARSATRALREVPFAAGFDGTILEGFVDLIIETADGIEIVDWKTDAITASEVKERLREYELQAGLYVIGIEAATKKPVTRVTYVFASPGVEESPGDPAALLAAARARLLEDEDGRDGGNP